MAWRERSIGRRGRSIGRTRRRSGTYKLITGLLAVSFLALLLPTSWTGRLINLVQIIVPLQDAAERSMRGLGDALDDGPDDRSVPVAEFDAALRENEGLRHALATLAQRMHELEDANAELTNLRQRWHGPPARLVPARVLVGDLLGWRESRLIGRGSLRGVRRRDAIVSRYFTIDAGLELGTGTGMNVLAGEVLVGVVDQVGTHTARVRMLSDPATGLAVHVARMEGDTLAHLPQEFWLVGTGQGGLQIRDVDQRYIENGDIREGDLAMTTGLDPRLPVSVVIGRLTDFRLDEDHRLLYILSVVPAVAVDELERVYVVATGPEAVGRNR